MNSTLKPWAVVCLVTMSLCVPALAGCTIFTGPTMRNDSLSAVSCLAANSCVAVGTEVAVTGESRLQSPIAMRWDGSRWHALAVRLPSGAGPAVLSSVSCKPGGCLAVGIYYPPANAGQFAFAEYWDDSAWAPVPLSLPRGPAVPALSAVSCVTVSECVATGGSEEPGSISAPLAATWDGRHWSWSQPPARADPASTHVLASVSCVTAGYCLAIGNAFGSGGSSPAGFTELWNGRGWTQAPAPGEASGVSGLSCPLASYCVAVGTRLAAADAGFGQIMDGTHWTNPAMPWPHGTGSSLYAVSCAGKTCLAVGEAGAREAAHGAVAEPAALSWNGATWTRQATPKGAVGTLRGVTCVTAADCVAVGDAQAGPGTRSLAELWNGTAWTIISPA